MDNQVGCPNLMQENDSNVGPILLQIKENLVKAGFSLGDSYLMSDGLVYNNASQSDVSTIYSELVKMQSNLDRGYFAIIIERAIEDLQNISDVINILDITTYIRLLPEPLDMGVEIAGDGSE